MDAERYAKARKRFTDAKATLLEAAQEMEFAQKEMEALVGVETMLRDERAMRVARPLHERRCRFCRKRYTNPDEGCPAREYALKHQSMENQ